MLKILVLWHFLVWVLSHIASSTWTLTLHGRVCEREIAVSKGVWSHRPLAVGLEQIQTVLPFVVAVAH